MFEADAISGDTHAVWKRSVAICRGVSNIAADGMVTKVNMNDPVSTAQLMISLGGELPSVPAPVMRQRALPALRSLRAGPKLMFNPHALS